MKRKQNRKIGSMWEIWVERKTDERERERTEKEQRRKRGRRRGRKRGGGRRKNTGGSLKGTT